jgi:hypothetical protein
VVRPAAEVGRLLPFPVDSDGTAWLGSRIHGIGVGWKSIIRCSASVTATAGFCVNWIIGIDSHCKGIERSFQGLYLTRSGRSLAYKLLATAEPIANCENI